MKRAKRRPSGRRLMVAIVTALLAAWAAALVVVSLQAGPESERRVSAPSAAKPEPFRGNRLPPGIARTPAPEFRLTDARGGEISTRELRGRPYAVTFLFTDCTDTCPVIAAELRRALELLGSRSPRVAVVAVSAKPKTDTSSKVRRWLRARRMPANFRYAIGSRRELKPVWKSYYAAPQGGAAEPHSSSIWLIDATGRIRTKFSAATPVPPGHIAHDLGVLVREAG
jgi:protein SCO1/2